MSYAPFDGVLLDDGRPPISGAIAMLLHLRVARRQAHVNKWLNPSLDAVKARAQACRELLAQGLLPATVRELRGHGLDLGDPRSPHSLAGLADHLEAYLAEVEQAGCLEPDAALWRAVDRELAGERGLWIERSAADGPIRAGLRDLAPARLRALACVPGLAGAGFALATGKGDGSSGLFGSSQPLVEWLLDGLEQHGQGFPNQLELEEPAGWGCSPWAAALERLYEGPLELGPDQDLLRRGLVDGPVDLLRHALEQVCAWLEAGIAPEEITVIYPEPQKAGAFLAPLLAREGILLHVRGGLLPLGESASWSPIWMLLLGLQRLDPVAFSGGLRASRRRDLRQWADVLAQADQDGPAPFADSFMHLPEWAKEGALAAWQELQGWRQAPGTARDWGGRIEALAASLRLALDPEDFFAPLGLLKEAWQGEVWTFPEMLAALRTFLEAARSDQVPRSPEGLRLVAPGTLLDDWAGARATLVLDLSEGAWPAQPAPNPDLDWNRKAAINQALLAATRAAADAVFPPALQRFWLPRSERGDQIPRAFQQEAYAFNKVLAMTREQLVVLSPGQDAEGRMKAQGPFWSALEGAGTWAPPALAESSLRWLWDGHEADPRAQARAEAARARTREAALEARAPEPDRVPGIRAAWLKGGACVSPTALEALARCPFRSLAERVWGLVSADAGSRFRMAVGTLAHHILEEALRPFLNQRGWPEAFMALHGLGADSDPEPLRESLAALWAEHRDAWLAELDELPREQWEQAGRELEALLPNLAAALLGDAAAPGPTRYEVAFLFPQFLPMAEAARKVKLPLQGGWTRTILALEGDLGPVDLDLGGGRTLAVAGKVDRLEHWAHEDGHEFIRVTDYKTSGSAAMAAYAEEGAPFAAHLQTPLYMLMVEQAHHFEATAALLPLRDPAAKPFTDHLRTLAADIGEATWRERLLGNLAGFDARLEAGDFPPTPGSHCQWCDLGALCGRPADVDREEEGE
jgi:hypothetical protein